MKKDIIKLFLLSMLLFIISSVITIIKGSTYTINFSYDNNDKGRLVVENEHGEIEVIEERIVDNKYIIKVKSKKPGKVFVSLDKGDYQETAVLYVHKTMVITDNTFFGKSTWSEVIPISLLIVLIYSLYLLIQKYKYHKKENLYQYKNIAYLGIIIFTAFLTINNILSIFNHHGLFETVDKIINTISFVSLLLFPLALITFILVTISNIVLFIKEGKSLKNLLGIFLGIFLCISTLIPNITYQILIKSQVINIYNLNGPGPYIYNFIESLIYLTISYLECILIGTIVIAIKSVKRKSDYNKDYIIILGCQIRKDGSLTPLLKGRVDKAIEFRNKQLKITNKDLIFIPSGGKGKDEVISEAEAMRKYLLEQGINENNILVENKSKNTYENIRFSNKLINKKNANIAFSTTNYHVLRAGLIATEQGLKLDGIGSKTKAYFWINAFIREFIGTLYSERKKHIIVFIIILLIIAIMIGISYLSNNI